MKKKKVNFTGFFFGLALALEGGILFGFFFPVPAAATSKKEAGFVKKNGSL